MKHFKYQVILGLFFPLSSLVYSQSNLQDSLSAALDLYAKKQAPKDTQYINLLMQLASTYQTENPDSSVYLSSEALKISKRLGFKKGRLEVLFQLARLEDMAGNYPRLLTYANQALKISQEIKAYKIQSELYNLVMLKIN
ncbi:MAG: hypothetical protein OHK0053_37560 [Microscillaceae bacterium]